MKFSNSSPSFSSCSSSLSTITSTTTTLASDAPLCTSKSATAGCLTGIFRRILRYGSSPTYPSDHITEGAKESNSVESCKDQDFKSNEKTGGKAEDKTETIANPGIVARLMGLESIPNSISRSKSMDFVDRFAGFDDDPMQVQHRRVKSTHSFREMPTFLKLESEEKFFVLSFENVTKNKEFRSKGRNSENGCGELKPKRGGKRETNDKKAAERKKKKQVEEEKGRRILKDLNGREMLRSKISSANGIVKDSTSTSIPKKAIKRKKKTICDVLKGVELECSSEDLSPVSVLDFDQFLVDPEVPTSDQEDSGLPCSRRTKTTRKGKCLGSRKKLCKSAEHIEMWSEICRLTEEELVGSNWIAQHNKDMWNNSQQGSVSAGIGADFESRILGQLLDELVDQFSVFYSCNSKLVKD